MNMDDLYAFCQTLTDRHGRILRESGQSSNEFRAVSRKQPLVVRSRYKKG
jgi:hypothetical protein